MKTRARGFTVIELMIVVLMLSVMLAIAVPSFRSFISNYRATSAINDFLQGVTITKNEALKRGRRVVMVPNTTAGVPNPAGTWANGWTIFADTAPFDYTLSAAERSSGTVLVFSHGPLPATTTTSDAGGASNPAFTDGTGKTYISFDGTGYPRMANGAVQSGGILVTDTMDASPNQRTMCLAVLGRPRLVKGTDSCTSG